MAELRSADLREALTALRDLLIERIEAAEPGETAALARQLSDCLSKVAALPSGEEKSILDDLTAKRAKRRAGVQGDPAEGVQRGK
jgi:hypothetical protein